MLSADQASSVDAAKKTQDKYGDQVSSVMNEDDHDLLKLGYRAVLARGWGGFDNFACSFSALYCIVESGCSSISH